MNIIARYTIDLNEELEYRLNQYMKENKIKLRSVAIKNCILKATDKETLESFNLELDKKLNRILYRQNMNKKLLEQLFVNMGFPVNEKIDEDLSLKKFYQDNNNYIGRFD